MRLRGITPPNSSRRLLSTLPLIALARRNPPRHLPAPPTPLLHMPGNLLRQVPSHKEEQSSNVASESLEEDYLRWQALRLEDWKKGEI